MVREELQNAAQHLEQTADLVDDESTDRLTDLAEQLDTLATAEKGPDHGRMARIQNALSDIKDTADDEATEHIDEAKNAISAYRETVDGV